ncbi:MAG: energy-coupling factor transporter transmembrane protein EcfT [Chloroflexota bacterium]|nr:energy-coupling factor transporter transmembrane protein EcfT [Chloroflexota bacterium]
MEEFEISRNITIGQYLALGSFVHKMDPRVKLLSFALLVAAITFSATYTANAILLVVVFALVPLSKVPIRYAVSGLKPAIPIVLLLAGLQIFFYTSAFAGGQNCASFFRWGPIDSNTCGVQLAIVSAARFIELLVLTSLLTFSTTITELTRGTEQLLAPLQRFNFPAHELALTMTIALRFVPTFAEELERIMKAQVSRGADLGGQGRLRFIQQTRALLPLIVPLFLSALRRAEELILAMEARCYVGGKGRTHFLEFTTKPSDWIAFAAVIAFAVAVLFVPFRF